MSTRDEEYLLPLPDKMKLVAYSQYIKRQGLKPTEYHDDAVSYLMGEEDSPPLAWDQAMDLLAAETGGSDG